MTLDDLNTNPSYQNMFTKRSFQQDYNSDEDALILEIIQRICGATSRLPASSHIVVTIRNRIDEEEEERASQRIQLEQDAILEELQTSDEKAKFLRKENKRLSRRAGILEVEVKQKEGRIEELVDNERNLRFRIKTLVKENNRMRQIEYAMSEAIKRNPQGGTDAFLNYIGEYAREEELEPEPDPDPEFKDLAELVDTARSEFSRLSFLGSALKSAKKTNADAPLSDVFEVFRELNNSIWSDVKSAMDEGRLEGQSRLNVHQLMRDSFGKKYAERESVQTMSHFQKNYDPTGRWFPLRSPDNVLVQIEPHIKMGSKDNPLRIHVLVLHNKSEYPAIEIFTKPNGKIGVKKRKRAIKHFPQIFIGWCGDHLPLPKKP